MVSIMKHLQLTVSAQRGDNDVTDIQENADR